MAVRMSIILSDLSNVINKLKPSMIISNSIYRYSHMVRQSLIQNINITDDKLKKSTIISTSIYRYSHMVRNSMTILGEKQRLQIQTKFDN